MRKLFLILFVIAIAVSAYAQKPDDVSIDTYEDKFSLSIAGFNIDFGSNEGPSTSYKDTVICYHHENSPRSTEFSVKRRRKASVDFDLLGPFYFGWNNWVNSNYYGNWDEQGDFLRLSSAFAFSMGFCNLSVSLNQRHTLYWTFGTKWTITNYKFMSHMRLADDSKGRLMPMYDDERPTSMLRTSYIGFPIGLSYEYHHVTVRATASVELLTNSWTRYNGEDDKFPLSGVNTFRSTAEVIVGYHGVAAFIDYGITPLFVSGVGNDIHALEFGFLICL